MKFEHWDFTAINGGHRVYYFSKGRDWNGLWDHDSIWIVPGTLEA